MSWISGTSLSFLASAPPASTVTKILLGALICAAAAYALYCHASPIRLTRVLVAAIAATEKTYLEAIEAGAISSSDVHTATTLTSLQLKVSNIREATLRNSLYHRAALGAFLEGRTLIILQCVRDVRRLETHVEILKEARLRVSDPTSESTTRTVSARQRHKIPQG